MSLELRRVTHAYGAASPVLRDLSFVFPEGRATAIMGPSGSGKTTLLAIAGLLTRPSAGEVLVDGAGVESRSRELRTRLFGWVYQTVNVLGRRSAEDNAMLGLLARGMGLGEARLAADEALAMVGLSRMRLRMASTLSGGELQRLCIARAIAARPRYLLADEPTGQLDRATTHQVARTLVEGRPANTTLIVVTHDPAVATQCDLVLALDDGALVIGGSL